MLRAFCSNQDFMLQCQFCHHGDDMSDIAGHLHSEHTESEKNIIAHHRCMVGNLCLCSKSKYKFMYCI